MFIKCSSCEKEFYNVPFSKARCHKKYKCTCGAIHELPITIVSIHIEEQVKNDNKRECIIQWIEKQNITEWLYEKTYETECLKGKEPTMDDILTNIRHILSDDESFVFFNKNDALKFKLTWGGI